MDPQSYPGYLPNAGIYNNSNAPSMFFNHKAEKIDWRRIAAVDINRITKELDFTSLQETIASIAFCDIEHELDSKYIDPNFVRLFKLAQLQIQYLLYSQDYLTGSLASEAEKGQAAMNELEKLRRDVANLRERQVDLKKQCHRYKKMVRIQQMLMPSSHDLHHPCPHCDKKFISRDFLANHLERRHRGIALQQPSGPAVNLSLGSASKEMEELREQLHQKVSEVDLLRQQISQGGHVDLTGFRHDMMQQHKAEMDALKSMFMEELKEVNSRYLSSQKALQELSAKQNQGSRSNLGEIEDDVEEDARLAEENRKLKAEIAREKAINERRKVNLEQERHKFENRMKQAKESTPKQRRLDENVSNAGKTKVDGDEELIQRRTAALAASEVRKSGPDKDSRVKSTPIKAMDARRAHDEESDEETEDESESILVSKEMKKTLADTEPGGTGEMSATSSWDISQLRSSRVMEKLKAEPSLLQGFISELRNILDERLMELGVDKNAKRLTTPVLNEKLAILRKEREQLARKHDRFMAIRQQYVKEVDKDAKERVRSSASGNGGARLRNPPPAVNHNHSPNLGGQRQYNGRRPPPRQSPLLDRRSATLPASGGNRGDNNPHIHPTAPHQQHNVPPLRKKDFVESSSESETTEDYASEISEKRPDPRPKLQEGAVQPSPPSNNNHTDSDVRPSPRKPRQHRPLSASNGINGNKLDSPESLNDWDTTDGKKLSLQMPGEGRSAPAGDVVMIPSRTAKKDASESEDDWDSDELQQLEDELAGTGTGANRVSYLSQTLEKEMQRSRGVKPPPGGVDIIPTGSSAEIGRRGRDVDDDSPFDDEDDPFEVSSLNGEDSRPPSRKVSTNGAERGLFGGNMARASVGSSGGAGGQTTSPSGLRLSAAGTDLSNTFGTSQWGTTSKVVSTVNPGATQKSMATNKSSDVGADDFDSD